MISILIKISGKQFKYFFTEKQNKFIVKILQYSFGSNHGRRHSIGRPRSPSMWMAILARILSRISRVFRERRHGNHRWNAWVWRTNCLIWRCMVRILLVFYMRRWLIDWNRFYRWLLATNRSHFRYARPNRRQNTQKQL